eukprot:5486611-Amphidinium_carterae.1
MVIVGTAHSEHWGRRWGFGECCPLSSLPKRGPLHEGSSASSKRTENTKLHKATETLPKFVMAPTPQSPEIPQND